MRKKVIKKVLMLLVATAMLVSPLSIVQAEEANEDFSQSEILLNSWEGSLQEGNRRYYGSDGQMVTGLQQIGGVTYFFSADGILQTGWQDVNGKIYYFDLTDGSRYENRKESVEGVEYDFDSCGNAVKVESDQSEYIEQEEGTVDNLVENNPVADSEPVEADKQQIPEDSVSDKKSESESIVSSIEKESGQLSTPVEAEAKIQTGWQSTPDGKIYLDSTGNAVKGIQIINGKLYYFNTAGILQYGWITDGNKKYFAAADGSLYKNQFIKFGSVQYYMGSDGSVQKGVVSDSNGNLYYADPGTGAIRRSAGWIDSGNKRYFNDAAGKLYKNQMISFGATQYYMGSDGSVQKGIVKAADGNIYYANLSSGMIQKKAGWIDTADNKRYFNDGTGRLYKNQMISFGSTWYYMGSDGSVQKGIVKAADGNIYYANLSSGMIQKKAGWIDTADGKKLFSDASGRLYKNQFISFGATLYYMGSDGSVQKGIVHASNGNSYYTDPVSGVLRKKAGWIDGLNNKKYYSDAAGKLYKNQFIGFGNTYYYCGSDAAILCSSSNYPIAGVLYTFGADGVMKKEAGWGEYKGNKYYKNPATGLPYKSQWISFGERRYYANSNGFMVSGWQNIGGKFYYFYPSTKLMARNTTIDGYIIGADGARVPTALSKMAARAWGYSSSTPYLILVDRDAHKVGIFTGSKGNWTNIKFWDCGNGAPSTPTKAGVFKVGIKGYYFDSGASRCFWYTQFYGNYLFHTVLCNKDGSIRDGRVGMALSHGCVRLQIPNAKWIYDNIPKNTTVVVY